MFAQVFTPNRQSSSALAKKFAHQVLIIWGVSAIWLRLFAILSPHTLAAEAEAVGSSSPFVTWLFALVISPIVETLILAYSVTIVKQIYQKRAVALAIAPIPICLLHAFAYWQLSILVYPPFWMQGVIYDNSNNVYGTKKSLFYVAMLHMVCNTITLIFDKLTA
jgi:hypothetical protein